MEPDQQDGTQEERPPGLNRRQFLKFLGFGAVGAAPLPILPSLLRTTMGRGLVRSRGEPAQAPNGRIRQWTMMIDLRYCDGCQSQ